MTDLTIEKLVKLKKELDEGQYGKVKDVFIEVHPESVNLFHMYLERHGVKEVTQLASPTRFFPAALQGILVKEDVSVRQGFIKLVTLRHGMEDEVKELSIELPSLEFGCDYGSQSWASLQLYNRSQRQFKLTPFNPIRYDIELMRTRFIKKESTEE